MEPSTQTSNYDDPVVAAQAKNLTKAIFQHESKSNYNAVGDAGTSHGAGQWQDATWKAQAQDVLGDSNAPMTPENQSIVAQGTIRKLIKQGHNAAQIAAIWNSGTSTDWENKIGDKTYPNGQVVHYDVPKYVKDVTDLYQQYKGQTPSPIPQQETAKQGGSLVPNVPEIGNELTTNIASRFQQGADSASAGIEGLAQGNLHKAASGALQTVGAAAGGIGDVVNAGLQLVPGVQAVEKGIGGLIGKVAETPAGQGIAQKLSDFSQAHPEISGDIGAAVNIASIIPLFKGIGLIKGGLTDAATSALGNDLKGAAATEMKNAIGTKAGITLARAESRGLDPLKVITSDHNNLPTIVERQGGSFAYDGEKGAANIQHTLSEDEEQMQQMLNQGVKKNVMVSLSQARSQMQKDVLREFPVSAKGGQAIKAVNEFFDNVAPTTGGRDFVSLNEINGLKRDIGGGVNWLNLGSKNGEIKAAMYRSLMNQVEKGATKAGVKGVKELNKVMAAKIEALNVLKALSGKTVKQSQMGKFIREITAGVAGAGGELVGKGTGTDLASTLAGRGLARFLPGRTPLTPTRLLGRSGRGSVRSSLLKGTAKSATGLGLRGLVAPPQGQ